MGWQLLSINYTFASLPKIRSLLLLKLYLHTTQIIYNIYRFYKMSESQFKYKKWIVDRLQPDLIALEEKIKSKENDLRELKMLEEYVDYQHSMWQEEKLIDIGEGVLAMAAIDKNSKLYLNVGLGFCCECSMKEAEGIIPLLQQKMQHQLDKLNKKAIDVRAHIQIAQQALNMLEEKQ
eukprot:TRINITY_DN652_c1_g1_i1.p3 TRINITY_DN652_c1_g1~~TRINITY_DN652_c1_g1_i1.p3  ORF type:complete len:178 (+),score=11.34 TRINITY_DN652_c1_g1_i1:76-609(+)